MSEREVDPLRPEPHVPITTGEFRASPDISASTAEFRAFADEDDAPWAMRTPRRNVARLAAIVVGVAAVLIIIAVLVLSN